MGTPRKLRTAIAVTNRQARRLEGENGLVWEMAGEGFSQREIASQLGITQVRVSQICKNVREALPQPDIEHLRLKRLYQFDEAFGYYLRQGMAGDAYAMRTALKIAEREARMVGYDSPVRIRAAFGDDSNVMRIEFLDDKGNALPDSDPRVSMMRQHLGPAGENVNVIRGAVAQ